MKEIGILDPYGKNKNPLTGKAYRKIYDFRDSPEKPKLKDEIAYQYYARINWSILPMYDERLEIIELIKKHQVNIINGGTGWGKTVILPKLALHAIDYKGKIVMTGPKKATTLSAAVYAAMCLDVELGQEVGFQYQGSKIEDKDENDEVITKQSKSSKTKLLFSTDGSVVQQLKRDPYMKEYDVVIIDEAHERSMNIDLMILLLRETLKLNPKLKLIVTSATLPEGKFENYFKEVGLDVHRKNLPSTPNKPVKVIYSKDNVPVEKRDEKILSLYKECIIDKNNQKDSLIFSVSENAAKKLCQKIKEIDKEVYCVEAGSGAVERDPGIEDRFKKKTLEDMIDEGFLNPNARRVLIATKIFESSVTLPNLITVFDNGLNYETNYDPLRMEHQLNKEQISKAQALQRKGRAGRTQPGICYFAYSKEQYDDMREDPELPILKNDLTENLYDFLMREGINNLGELLVFLRKFMDRPKKEFILSALKTLDGFQLISGMSSDDTITEKGKKVLEIKSKLNDINYSITLYYAKIYKCSQEISMILGMLKNIKSAPSEFFIFFDTSDKVMKKKVEERINYFKENEGDTFSLWGILKQFLRAKYRSSKNSRDPDDSRDWCRRNYLNYNKLQKASEDARDILRNRTFVEEPQEFEIPDINDRIRYCLLKGFVTNIAQFTGRTKKDKFSKKELPIFENFFPTKKSMAPLSTDSYVSKANFIIYKQLYSNDGNKSFIIITKINKDIINLLDKSEKRMLEEK